MDTFSNRLTPVLSTLAILCVSAVSAAGSTVEVIQEIKHDTSQALRTMAETPAPAPQHYSRPMLSTPGHTDTSDGVEDPALQEIAGSSVRTTPGLNLLGLGTGFVGPSGTFSVQFAPPDTNGAAGDTQYVQMVNIDYAVFDKTTGNPTLGPLSFNTIFNGFGGSCASTNVSDPTVLYDKLAGRWFIEYFTVNSPYAFCLAVSSTSDATGSYHRYAFRVSSGLPDYAKTGIWPDAYYISARLFQGGANYIGPMGCAADRTKMLAGAAATLQCIQINNTSLDGMLPSDLDGSTAPVAGTPNYYVVQGPTGSNSLQLYKFHVDFVTPANTTFTGPTSIPVAAYTQAGSSSAVPQPGTSQKLDALGNFLMFRLSYRSFASAATPYESLLLTHSINVGRSTSRRIGVRWYEIRNPGTATAVFQQGTYSPSTLYRWMGSIAQDKLGNIAVGYSGSSTTVHPEILYTGRVPTDPLGKLEAEAVIFAGTGSQNGGLNRWGDYSGMSVDPVDDCTFYYTTEYLPSTGSFNWATRIFSFKFPSCH